MHIHYNYANPVLLKQAEADNFRLISVNVESASSPSIDMQEITAIDLLNGHREIFIYLSTISNQNWLSDQWEASATNRIDASVSTGASVVKIWENIGMELRDADSSYVLIDHHRFDPVLSHMEQNHIPLLAHICEPKNCWLPLEEMTTKKDRNYFSSHPEYHMHLHPEMPAYDEIINARDHMLEKHKNLKVVGAHFGSIEWNTDSLANQLDKYPNFAEDMAARIGHMHYQSDRNYDKVPDFSIKYDDRILYGTDIILGSESLTSAEQFHNEWFSDWKYLATDEGMKSELIGKEAKGLKLPKNIIDDIYFNNATTWYSKIGF